MSQSLNSQNKHKKLWKEISNELKYLKLGLKVSKLDCYVMAASTYLWPFPDPVPLVSWKLNFEISDFHPASSEAVVRNYHTLHMTYSSYFHEKLWPKKMHMYQ